MEKTRGMVRQDLSLGPVCASPFHLSRYIRLRPHTSQLATGGCGLLPPTSLQTAAASSSPARYTRLWPPPTQLAPRGCGLTPPSSLHAAVAPPCPARYTWLRPPAELATCGCGPLQPISLQASVALRGIPSHSVPRGGRLLSRTLFPVARVPLSVSPQQTPATARAWMCVGVLGCAPSSVCAKKLDGTRSLRSLASVPRSGVWGRAVGWFTKTWDFDGLWGSRRPAALWFAQRGGNVNSLRKLFA